MTAIFGTHAQVSFPPSSLLHSSQGLFGSEGGSGYSRSRDVEFDTDSLSACSLVDEDEEPEEPVRSPSVTVRCNAFLTILLTSQSAWTISDQSTSEGMQIRNRNANGSEGEMCKGEDTHVSEGRRTSWVTWSDWVALIASLGSGTMRTPAKGIVASGTVLRCPEAFLDLRVLDRKDRTIWWRMVRRIWWVAEERSEENTPISSSVDRHW